MNFRVESCFVLYMYCIVAHLVNHAHEVGVGPALLVQVVRLKQHAAQLLRSDVPEGREEGFRFPSIPSRAASIVPYLWVLLHLSISDGSRVWPTLKAAEVNPVATEGFRSGS